MLVGRGPERRLIESLLADARGGRSGSLVVRGEPGIGKTALLEETAAHVELRTLRCTGVQSEHDLPFAALQQLLRPLTRLVERLPGPQAEALRSALGLEVDRGNDRLLIGLATLNLLAEATGDGPIVCLADDLQWIDQPSAQALLFAARRLEAEGVVMLFAVRDDPADWYEIQDLPQLTLTRLTEDAARELIASRSDIGAGDSGTDTLLREAAGNPLALLELAVGANPGGERGRIEATFRARFLRLPDESRRLLLVAAVAEAEEIVTWSDAGRLADAPREARNPAVAAGLVADSDTILFRHPLVRSAVYNAASSAERADAHRQLAGSAADPMGRAAHLAAAADAPDADVAAALETAASGAVRRGAFATAAAAYARAAALSDSADDRARRLIWGAQAWLDAGRSDHAVALADQALAAGGQPADRAVLLAVRGALAFQGGTPDEAYEHYSAAARLAADADPEYGLVLEGLALGAALFGGWPERVFDDARAYVQGLTATETPARNFLQAFLGGAAALMRGASDEARDLLRQAAQVGAEIGEARDLVWVGLAALYLGDVASAKEHYVKAAAAARASGSFTVLPQALLALAQLHIAMRSFALADECTREGIELAQQLGQANLETCFSAVLVRVLAAQGNIDECRDVAERALQPALARNLGVAVSEARYGLAELEIGLGNGATACELIEGIPLSLSRFAATPDFVEASLLAGDPGPAVQALDSLAAYAERGKDPYFLALVARCRAQLEPDPERADALYREALSFHALSSPPHDRARTELVYGESLRRNGRRVEARAHLRDALGIFEGLGMPLWSARARAELEATGITARKRDPSTLDALTPQELRIARLVGAGASNRDVATQLFLSPKTVEYHLRKVFLKLGISSRVELARQPFEPIPVTAGTD